jgi:hypothetical protein
VNSLILARHRILQILFQSILTNTAGVEAISGVVSVVIGVDEAAAVVGEILIRIIFILRPVTLPNM